MQNFHVNLFTSPRCTACKVLKQMLTELEVEFDEIDISRNPEAAREAHVTHVPMLIFYKDGKVAEIVNSLVSKERLENILDEIGD